MCLFNCVDVMVKIREFEEKKETFESERRNSCDVFGWGFGVKRSLHADNVLSCNNGYSLFKLSMGRIDKNH